MNARDPVLFALILAAGGSRRLGSPKQLLRHGGETLVQRALRLAAGPCGGRTLLVLGAEYARVLRSGGEAVRYFVVNERWQEGLAGSLTLGLECLPEDCDGVLVLLADQPLVDETDLARLATAWRNRPDAIAASRYGGRGSEILGVPAVFPRRLFPELRELTGDRGARPVIERQRRRHPHAVVAVDCEHAAVDIDTPADAAALARGSADPEN
ncbi:nucleotidyltransferase family protein [Lentisalinibacter orientalis]|uniref:nucleotidyltransferase family protein n=1 Tax=Lentisalinibacter orientalis TaxID=2992241 RepID=UPI003862E42B